MNLKGASSLLSEMNKNDLNSIHDDSPPSVLGLGAFDVICGRCKLAFNNIGNRRFRVIIGLNLDRYMEAPSRQAKSQVIIGVVKLFQNEIGARFVKEQSNGSFTLVSDKMVRQKVGHALRDLAAQKLGGPTSGNERTPDPVQSSKKHPLSLKRKRHLQKGSHLGRMFSCDTSNLTKYPMPMTATSLLDQTTAKFQFRNIESHSTDLPVEYKNNELLASNLLEEKSDLQVSRQDIFPERVSFAARSSLSIQHSTPEIPARLFTLTNSVTDKQPIQFDPTLPAAFKHDTARHQRFSEASIMSVQLDALDDLFSETFGDDDEIMIALRAPSFCESNATAGDS